MVFNNGINQSDPDGGGFVWFYMLLAAIVCVAALFFSMVTGLSVLRYNQLVEHANVTQGVLIERIRIPHEKYEPDYYLRYKFDNPVGVEFCAINTDKKITPRNKQCLVTVARVEVGKDDYKAAIIPSSIDVLYHSNEKGTWSEPLDYPTRARKIGYIVFMSLLSLLSGVFAWKSAKVVTRGSKKSNHS